MFINVFLLIVVQMNDRRGHRKLRLCSRKKYQSKRRLPLKKQSLLISIPLKNISIPFLVSLPLSSYTDGPVVSVDLLHVRLEHCKIIPSGIIMILFSYLLLVFY